MTACPKPGSKSRMIRIIVLIVLVATIALMMAETQLNQIMLDLAYAQAYSLAVETINQAVWDVMQGGVTYDQLITMEKDAQGHITMLSANTILMNELATKIALMAEAELSLAENQMIGIPLGAALGVKFLAGAGPRINVKIIPVGAVSTQFATEFQSAGINQTRHKISLLIATTVRLVIPTGSQRVDVISTVPIAESIIVGTVPNTFMNIGNDETLLNLLP